jgi:hypothetical protein
LSKSPDSQPSKTTIESLDKTSSSLTAKIKDVVSASPTQKNHAEDLGSVSTFPKQCQEEKMSWNIQIACVDIAGLLWVLRRYLRVG